jgi:hypothetical protein
MVMAMAITTWMVIEWDGGEDSGNKGWHEDGECDEDGDGGSSDKCDGSMDGD